MTPKNNSQYFIDIPKHILELERAGFTHEYLDAYLKQFFSDNELVYCIEKEKIYFKNKTDMVLFKLLHFLDLKNTKSKIIMITEYFIEVVPNFNNVFLHNYQNDEIYQNYYLIHFLKDNELIKSITDMKIYFEKKEDLVLFKLIYFSDIQNLDFNYHGLQNQNPTEELKRQALNAIERSIKNIIKFYAPHNLELRRLLHYHHEVYNAM